jgi:hypothetical protein
MRYRYGVFIVESVDAMRDQGCHGNYLANNTNFSVLFLNEKLLGDVSGRKE